MKVKEINSSKKKRDAFFGGLEKINGQSTGKSLISSKSKQNISGTD